MTSFRICVSIQVERADRRKSNREIEQQAHRAEKERQSQARYSKPVRNPMFGRIAHLPAPNEQIECQVVNPSREQQPTIAEERRDTGERSEASRSLAPVQPKQARIDDPEDRWDQRPCDQTGRPPHSSRKNENEPARHRG